MKPRKLLSIFRTTRTTGDVVTPVVMSSSPEKEKNQVIEKASDVLGGFFDLSTNRLSGETTISDKLLQANSDWVYRNNDVIAKEVGDIEFELYKVSIVQGQFEYEEINDHPVLQLLDKFNETTTKTDGIYITQSHKKLAGEAFWLLDGSGTNIDNIFIIEPDKVEIVLGDFTDSSKRLIEKYIYKTIVDGKEVKREYLPEQIIHIKTPNPNNPYRGYGAVEAAANTIDLDWLTTDLSKKFFKNGAITNFILSTEGRIQDDQLKRLKAEFKSAYGGSKNAFKTMILGGGLKPTTIQASNRDMEFLAQLEWYRDKIMVLFGNTKASLGIIDDVNRASHESSIISWKRNSVKPEMQAIVNALNEYLVPRYGDNLLLGFSNPIPEDREAKLKEMEVAIKTGIISRNEAREMLGYDTIEGEEHDRVPVVNVNPLPDALTNIDTEKILRARGWYKKLKEYNVYKDMGKVLAKKQMEKRRKHSSKNTELVNNLIDKPIKNSLGIDKIIEYTEKWLTAQEQTEVKLKNRIEQFITDMVNEALSNYPEKQPKHYTKQLIDEESYLVRAELDFAPLLRDLAVIAGNEALDLLSASDMYFPYDYEKTILGNVKKFTESMVSTDQDKMVKIISQGLKEGKGIPAIRSDIQNEFGQYSKMQAERIARTESTRTANQAAIDAFKQSGLVVGKQWVAAWDADEICLEYHGKVVWDLDGNFYSPEGGFEDGDPPLHVNCRCQVVAVVDKGSELDLKTMDKIKELENMIDKRTKEYRDLQKEKLEQDEYITALEKIAGVSDGEV